jgi:hypothetical protein
MNAIPSHCSDRRRRSVCRVDREWDDRPGCGDRARRSPSPDGQAAVESRHAGKDRDACTCRREELRDAGKRIARRDDPDEQAGEPDRLRDDDDGDHGQSPGREPAEEVPDAPHEAAAEGEECSHEG